MVCCICARLLYERYFCKLFQERFGFTTMRIKSLCHPLYCDLCMPVNTISLIDSRGIISYHLINGVCLICVIVVTVGETISEDIVNY